MPYARRGADGIENTLSINGYRQAGGATGAIARTADTVYDQLTTAERDIAKRIFLRLTALGEGAEDSRRRVPVDVLAASERSARSRASDPHRRPARSLPTPTPKAATSTNSPTKPCCANGPGCAAGSTKTATSFARSRTSKLQPVTGIRRDNPTPTSTPEPASKPPKLLAPTSSTTANAPTSLRALRCGMLDAAPPGDQDGGSSRSPSSSSFSSLSHPSPE